MIEQLRTIRRKLKHKLKLYPIYKVTDKLLEKNVLQNAIILEAFSNTGGHQAPAYYPYSSYFEAWEITPKYEKDLHKNLPNATIKITDSFKEVNLCNRKFNMIVLDAHMGIFGDKDQYCEHFEILPQIFKLCMDECVLVFNVMPFCENKWKQKYETVFREKHLNKRKAFYNCTDANNVPYEFMTEFYTQLCIKNGFNVDWVFYHQRHLLHYCVIRIIKQK